MKFTGIRAVSFDGDQTLWDFRKVMRHSLEQVMKELRKRDPVAAARLDIDTMIAVRNRIAEEFTGHVHNLEEVRLTAFQETLRVAGRPNDSLAAELNTLYLKHRFEDTRPYGDVVPALQQFKKRFRLGLLSNGNSYPERCGLDGMFDFIVFSQDCGADKPAPAFYAAALEAAGCRPQELLHVGDSIENDVIGARAAGINAVWLDRDGALSDGLPPEVPVIHSLRDVLQMV